MEGDSDSSSETTQSSVLSLEVTQEQRDAIYHFFAYNNWDFKEVISKENEVNHSENSENGDDDHGNYFIEQEQEAPECPYCFCRPCITDEQNRQLWWENEYHERNTFLRKDKFKRFWTNLFHRGAWNDPRYLRIKKDSLKRDRPRQNYVFHRRDIIPKCVLELVRKWLPNPADKPYMGHKWD